MSFILYGNTKYYDLTCEYMKNINFEYDNGYILEVLIYFAPIIKNDKKLD